MDPIFSMFAGGERMVVDVYRYVHHDRVQLDYDMYAFRH